MLNQPKDTYDADYAEEPWEEEDVYLSLSNTDEEFFPKIPRCVWKNDSGKEMDALYLEGCWRRTLQIRQKV